jgi:hypothetical protein
MPEGIETWQKTSAQNVWLTRFDRHGNPKAYRVAGEEGARVQVKTDDREFMQQKAPNGPFTNGMLKRVDADQNADPETASVNALTSDELKLIFRKKGPPFTKAVGELDERNVRRMRDMCDDVDASASQLKALQDRIDNEFTKTVVTSTYKEMQADGDVYGAGRPIS